MVVITWHKWSLGTYILSYLIFIRTQDNWDYFHNFPDKETDLRRNKLPKVNQLGIEVDYIWPQILFSSSHQHHHIRNLV